jgi:hypothetical protein
MSEPVCTANAGQRHRTDSETTHESPSASGVLSDRRSHALSRKVVNLTPSRRESVPNRCLSVFMSRFIGSRMIDNDVLVRRDRQPNVDLKSVAMAVLVAWSDNGYAASRNALIVCLQPLDLF